MNDNSQSLEDLMQQLLVELRKINKAMSYTEKKATRKEKYDQLEERIQMSIIMSGRQNKAS